MLVLAEKVVRSQVAVTGVQAKLSLSIQKPDQSEGPARFTIVGLWGDYILKPPAERFPFLPEIEDLTMHLAELSKIKVVPHALIKLKGGKPAYDLLSSALVMGDLDEEGLALTLNGKKRKIKRNDFTEAMKRSRLEDRMIMNIFRRFEGMTEKWNAFIDISFLPDEMKKNYKDLIRLKAEQLEIH